MVNISDNSKPIFLLIANPFPGENYVWSPWFLFITESFRLDTSGKTTTSTTPICLTV